MDVRLEDVRDRNLLLARQLDVFVHVRRGIEDGRDAVAVVAEEIGELGDAFGLDAFKD